MCRLSSSRHKIVLARGTIPSPLFFCGEAPGRGEDTLGRPFVGPAGQLLDEIIRRALEACGRPTLKYAMGNLLGCIPVDADMSKVHAPPPECVDACRPRLESLVAAADPKLIVALGLDPKAYLEAPGYYDFTSKVPVVHCYHPAFVIRQDGAGQRRAINTTVAALVSAIDRYIPEDS